MITKVPVKQLNKAIAIQKDFLKAELLNMDYFKTPSGKQLYELSLRDPDYTYQKEKARLKYDSKTETPIT
ncbi:Fur-regulated basic protein FbpA [Peribacillus asahii]|uniref:Fur-regulated basic protein FbpA n=1 Tax=Peribacillus asahii TaxID=228899 RepID=UPI00207A868F|nr:Fur-regulated basic protein FbpA [Peribacillus asahii]USK68416.1 Fur-regulated basic protein FbpA [Peribacillus asahii]